MEEEGTKDGSDAHMRDLYGLRWGQRDSADSLPGHMLASTQSSSTMPSTSSFLDPVATSGHETGWTMSRAQRGKSGG